MISFISGQESIYLSHLNFIHVALGHSYSQSSIVFAKEKKAVSPLYFFFKTRNTSLTENDIKLNSIKVA